ncbi:NHL repeat containing protein [Oopsacas minuta]|uniref:NHL repeat containing protein n=1 Tax=Oopsacas minuta TaxID=111878 RepID=A0AAV7JGD6_9METZ|nr:NHL repeat containing protein [Oopsacas minuta]
MATANTLERIFSVDYKSKIQPNVSLCIGGRWLENLKNPNGVTIDNSTGDIYVADWRNHCVKVFDCNGQIMFKFGDEEGEGKMNGPMGLAICRDRILISQSNNCILNCQLNGEFISRIGKPGKGALEFYDPLGLTFDESNGEVYICDYNNNRIQILSKELSYKTQFGQDNLKSPFDIKLTKEFIYILDRSNPCLHLYNCNLILHKSILSRGDGLQLNIPRFFYIDNSSNILITNHSDISSGSISIFNSQFDLIHKISIAYPTGIAVDNRGRVIVIRSYFCINRALCYIKLSQFEATPSDATASEIDPDDTKFHYRAAISWSGMGNHVRAIEVLRNLVVLAKDNSVKQSFVDRLSIFEITKPEVFPSLELFSDEPVSPPFQILIHKFIDIMKTFKLFDYRVLKLVENNNTSPFYHNIDLYTDKGYDLVKDMDYPKFSIEKIRDIAIKKGGACSLESGTNLSSSATIGEMVNNAVSLGVWCIRSLLNHSCVGNIVRVVKGKVSLLKVFRDVKAEEELTISAIDGAYKMELKGRKETLKLLNAYNCKCLLCKY